MRIRARVTGTVQGVGFRPHVYRLARELELDGYVLNDSLGVLLEVQGGGPLVERFLERLRSEAPPLAAIEAVLPETLLESRDEGHGFRIVESVPGAPAALVSADTATCEDCLAELFDPGDRRHRYPFVNCTNCGPRFTIVRGVPYDRPLTTMARFEMCPACLAEYEDPGDRRFHAQPNACPECGPALRLPGGSGDPLATAVDALDDGLIVAVKGIGGFHLACRADDEAAVGALRARKHREDRPFALMVRDLDAGRALCELGPAEEALLAGRARPIVLARRRPGARVAPSVAPRSPDLGLMLPYSPLHHLLLADTGLDLVMTSGNVSDEPIAFSDDDALVRLRGVADLFLLHDRPIRTRSDDSVVRVVRGRPQMIRRSRGHVPHPVGLPTAVARPVLACGAELKNTFCLAQGDRAWVGHHIGDLRNYETLQSFRDGVEHFEELFDVRPEVVAHDLHPDYLSTSYAREREGVELVGVQHHHAHLAACLAEHGETGPAIGAIYDGSGHGTDGTVWGGEILAGDLRGFERVGHLHPVRLPGGDRAVREPWRMSCAWLVAIGHEHVVEGSDPYSRVVEGLAEQWDAVRRMAQTGFSAPVTTSMGRLFDAVSALCGVRTHVTHEGQAAVELEALAEPGETGAYPLPVSDELVLDARETVEAVVADLGAGTPAPVVSARFHAAVALATARACSRAAAERGLSTVVLSGGVFQNRVLLERTASELERARLRVLVPEVLPPNDGGVSYGQVAVAAARDGRP